MIKELESYGVIYHRGTLTSNKKAIVNFPLRLKKLVDTYRPDVIQTHTEIPDLAVFLFHKLFPFYHFKLVRTLHNTVLWNSWGKIGKIVEKRDKVPRFLNVLTKRSAGKYGTQTGRPA